MKKIIFLASCLLAISAFAQTGKPFQGPKLRNVDGVEVDLTSEVKKGNLTVIVLWATWNSPGKAELSAINELYKEWQANYRVVVYAVATDNSRTSKNVKPVAVSKGWTFEVLHDPNEELLRKLNPTATLPFLVLIDRNGNIVNTVSGYVPGDEQKLEEEIKKIAPK